jgi:hypothetical protein
MLSRKFQDGGQTNQVQQYVFKSIKELLDYKPSIAKIPIKSDKGNYICLGAALNCNIELGHNYRTELYRRKGKGPEIVIGDKDNTVDSWNMLAAAYNSDDMEVLYDRYRDGEISQEMLDNLPVHALIGTGDARGHFGISTENPNILSRHTITVPGFMENGKPIIYDLGKLTQGIDPEKYKKNNINFVVAPKSKRIYFKDVNPNTSPEPVVASAITPTTPDAISFTTPNISNTQDIELPELIESNASQTYSDLMNRARYQRQQLRQRKQMQEQQETT